MSLRHDRIVATLATLARSVGFAVKREPPFDHRTHLRSRVDMETGEEHDELTEPAVTCCWCGTTRGWWWM